VRLAPATEPRRKRVQLLRDHADLEFVRGMTIEGVEVAIRDAANGDQVPGHPDLRPEVTLVLDDGFVLEAFEVVLVALPRRRARMRRGDAVAPGSEPIDPARKVAQDENQ